MKITDLTMKYGNKTIIHHAHMHFPAKTLTCITGISGSGKSSLLSVLGLLQQPTQVGTYELLGETIDFAAEHLNALRRNQQLGFIFQEFHLIPGLTVADNIALPLYLQGMATAEIKGRTDRILEDLSMEDLGASFPYQLSGGEKQRVCIARALITEPAIILADEPTAALDQENTTQVMELLQHIAHTKRVIVVTHDRSLLPYADGIYEIQQQKVKLVQPYHTEYVAPEGKYQLKTTQSTFGFARMYRQKTHKQLHKFILPLLAIIIGCASYFALFGQHYLEAQQQVVAFFSPNVFSLIKKDFTTGSTYDDVNRNFTTAEIAQLKQLSGIDVVYEYHQLPTRGQLDPAFAKDAKRSLQFRLGTDVVEFDYQYHNDAATRGQIDLVGKLPEQNFAHMLLAGNPNAAFIVSVSFLKQHFPNRKIDTVVGDTLSFDILVPTKLFEVQNKFSHAEVIGDTPYYKIITVTKQIGAIVDDTQVPFNIPPEERSSLLFLPQAEVDALVKEHQSTNINDNLSEFKEHTYQAQKLQVIVDQRSDPAILSDQIAQLSRNYQVIQPSAVQKVLTSQVHRIRTIALVVIAFIGSLILIIYLIYYSMFLAKRKYEFGLLKVIGLSPMTLLLVMSWELLHHIFIIWGLSVLIQGALNVLELVFFAGGSVNLSFGFIGYNLLIASLYVFIPSFPILWHASKVDPTKLIARS